VEVCFEEGLEGFPDVGEGGLETVRLVDFANPGLDAGGFTKGEEKLVGGEADEELLAGKEGVVGEPEEHFTGIKGEDGIADPGKVSDVSVVHATGWGRREGIVKVSAVDISGSRHFEKDSPLEFHT